MCLSLSLHLSGINESIFLKNQKKKYPTTNFFPNSNVPVLVCIPCRRAVPPQQGIIHFILPPADRLGGLCPQGSDVYTIEAGTSQMALRVFGNRKYDTTRGFCADRKLSQGTGVQLSKSCQLPEEGTHSPPMTVTGSRQEARSRGSSRLQTARRSLGTEIFQRSGLRGNHFNSVQLGSETEHRNAIGAVFVCKIQTWNNGRKPGNVGVLASSVP